MVLIPNKDFTRHIMVGWCCNMSDILQFTWYDHEKIFHKKIQIALVKNDTLLSMHYLMLATLATLAKWFVFTGMTSVLHKFALILWGTHFLSHKNKKGGKICIFSWNHDVWIIHILNEHDGMHQFVNSGLFLTRDYARETSSRL